MIIAISAEAHLMEKPKRKQFIASYKLKKLPEDQAKRQGRITLMAWDALGREAALQFLNGRDDTLGGRPLDLATASNEGFEMIERTIRSKIIAIPSQ